MHAARILIVEDSPSLALTYREYLSAEHHTAVIAGTAADARRMLAGGIFSLVILDLNLPDAHGTELLESLRTDGFAAPVVVVTADVSPVSAASALRAGADDYISKPLTAERLNLTVRHLLEKQSLLRMVDDYRVAESGSFCGFVGKSPVMQAVYRILENAAHSKAPVFITGESGTGKELAARAIHDMGPRGKKVFEALNCAAIPANLLESEIFGHARGAFTGAVAAYAGAAERADGGTLFMDELGEMPVEMQSKLLRFTQSGTFRPVGAAREVAVDLRFVSATNRDPLQAVHDGRMREDLYYRLNVIPVHLPPLRERGDDVILIAEKFLTVMAREERKNFTALTPQAAEWLMQNPWPGNVRQLQNVLRRAVVMNDGDSLSAAMLAAAAGTPAAAPVVAAVTDSTGVIPLRELERRAIERAIDLCRGNITEAARRLGVNASTLHRKMSRWRAS